MTLPVWPANVPYKPLVGSWDITPFLQPLGTEMDGGNARLRRKPGDDVATVNFKIAMKRDEWDALRVWMKTKAAGGTSRFTMTIWTGNGLAAKTVQFAPQFQPTAAEYGVNVSVTMKLRVYGL